MEFLGAVDRIMELNPENRKLGELTDRIIASGDTDASDIRKLESVLAKYNNKILALYTKDSENIYLNSLHQRAGSLLKMCRDLLNGS